MAFIQSSGGYRNAPGTSATPPSSSLPSSSTWSAPAGTTVINTGDIRSAAAGFSDDGTQTNDLFQTLSGTLNGNDVGGVPWGNDSLGQSFGAQYTPAATTALTALQDLISLFQTTTTNLDNVAGIFENTEDENVTLATSLAL